MRKDLSELFAKVSFDADNEHRLQDGVKVSLDLIVDKANELYASLPGAGSSKEFPFVEINIKHLNLQDGTNENLLPVDIYEYKTDLQLSVKEHIEIPGLLLAGNPLPKIDFNVQAKIDLQNEGTANTTQLHAYLQVTMINKTGKGNKYSYAEQEPKAIMDLTYAQGRLSFVVDNSVSLVDLAADATRIYGFLANPVGNMLYNLLKGVDATHTTAFPNLYWTDGEPKLNEDTGKTEGGSSFNKNFKYFVIDKMQVSDLLAYFGIGGAEDEPAVSSDEGQEAPETPAEPTIEANMYNGIVKIFTMLGMDGDKISVKSRGLFGTICDVAAYFGAKDLTPDSIVGSIVGLIDGLGDMADTIKTALGFEGVIANDLASKFNWVFIRDKYYENDPYNEYEDNLNFNFYFTESGINWDASWFSQYDSNGSRYAADGTDLRIGVVYTSEIGFGLPDPYIIAPFDLKAYENAKKAYEGLATKEEALPAKQQAVTEATTTRDNAKDAYEKSEKYLAFDQSLKDLAAAQTALDTQIAKGIEIYPNWTKMMQLETQLASNYCFYYYNQPQDRSYYLKQNTSKNMYKWIADGKKDSGDLYDKAKAGWDKVMTWIGTKITDETTQNKVGALFDKNYETHKADSSWTYDGDVYNAYVDWCTKLYDTTVKEEAALASDEYKALTGAETALTTAQKTLSDAQAEIQTIKDNYLAYYVWDLSANPPTKPEPAPAE